MTIEFVIKSACPPSSDRNNGYKLDANQDVQEIFLYKIIDYEQAAANNTGIIIIIIIIISWL